MNLDSLRYNVVRVAVLIIFVVMGIRLFNLQILDDELKARADGNALRYVVQYPPRGEVYDRNGEFLVRSRESYDILIVPRDVEKFDTVALANTLQVEVDDLKKAVLKARRYSMRQPSIIFKEFPKEVKLRLDEKPVKGFYTQFRTMRTYPSKIAGNLLGYVGKVPEYVLKRDKYYDKEDYIGMSGIEQAYEEHLRGEKGMKVQMVDVYGVPQGSYQDGARDVTPTPGSSIYSTLDGKLQALAEELLEGKVGSVVAIEPSTGQILVMASSPSYDPDLLVGPQRGNNYMKLLYDKRRPLFNRSVMAYYPPGSTFKVINGLLGMQFGVVKPTDTYTCHGRYPIGRGVGCHNHNPTLDMTGATQNSCNTYFCYVYRDILDNGPKGNLRDNYRLWEEGVHSFGFGRKLNSDFRGELSGIVRDVEYFDRVYNKSWNSLTVVSMSIGQGELGVTPLQMANLAAIVANRGYYYIPHVVSGIGVRDSIDNRFKEKHYTVVDPKHFDCIVEGMYRAVHEAGGTAQVARVNGLDICGKTGTAQNPQGADHSTFMSFAPRNNPKIAISVYIEHGRFGGSAAAPIASLIEEQYLTDTITRPELVRRMKDMHINYPMYDKK